LENNNQIIIEESTENMEIKLKIKKLIILEIIMEC